MAIDRRDVRMATPKLELEEKKPALNTGATAGVRKRPLDLKTQRFIDDANAIVERYPHAEWDPSKGLY